MSVGDISYIIDSTNSLGMGQTGQERKSRGFYGRIAEHDRLLSGRQGHNREEDQARKADRCSRNHGELQEERKERKVAGSVIEPESSLDPSD